MAVLSSDDIGCLAWTQQRRLPTSFDQMTQRRMGVRSVIAHSGRMSATAGLPPGAGPPGFRKQPAIFCLNNSRRLQVPVEYRSFKQAGGLMHLMPLASPVPGTDTA